MFETFENWLPTVLAQSGGLTPRRPIDGSLQRTGRKVSWFDAGLVTSWTSCRIESLRYDPPSATATGPAHRSIRSPEAESSTKVCLNVVRPTFSSRVS